MEGIFFFVRVFFWWRMSEKKLISKTIHATWLGSGQGWARLLGLGLGFGYGFGYGFEFGSGFGLGAVPGFR